MPFLKCKSCIVRACCRVVCKDFKEYCKKKCNITIGNNISLKQATIAFGDIEKVDKLTKNWVITTTGGDSLIFTKKGENNDKK